MPRGRTISTANTSTYWANSVVPVPKYFAVSASVNPTRTEAMTAPGTEPRPPSSAITRPFASGWYPRMD